MTPVPSGAHDATLAAIANRHGWNLEQATLAATGYYAPHTDWPSARLFAAALDDDERLWLDEQRIH